MYYALPSWYVRTTAIKDRLLAENEATNWYPETIKHGRYGDWLNNNIDWALSRDRYWGTPLPVWRNDADPTRLVCVGSLAELHELSGVELDDPHRPFVDDVTFTLPGEDGTYRRVPQVIDAWFDSGSMPFAQFGAPYRNADEAAGGLPGRLHLRGDRPDPRLVLLADGGRHAGVRRSRRTATSSASGHILAEDGRKMSKHLGNILEPIPLMDRHGADALRWFMLVQRLAVVVAPGRAQGAGGDRVQGDPHVLVGRVVPVAVRPGQRLDARRRRRRPHRCSTGGRCPRCTGSPPRSTTRWRTSTPRGPARRSPATSTTCRTGTCAARGAGSGTATRPRSATLHECLRRADPAARAVRPVRDRDGCGGRCSPPTGRSTRCTSRRGRGRRDPGRRRRDARRAGRAGAPAGRAGPLGPRGLEGQDPPAARPGADLGAGLGGLPGRAAATRCATSSTSSSSPGSATPASSSSCR